MPLTCFHEAESFCALSQRFGHMKITAPEVTANKLENLQWVSYYNATELLTRILIGLCHGFSACPVKNVIQKIQFCS